MIVTISPRRITTTLFAIGVVLMLVGLVGIFHVWDIRLLAFGGIFEINSEGTVSTWYASILLAVAALVCGLITYDHTLRQQPYTRRWGYLTLILMGMSIEEIIMFHELVLPYFGRLVGGGSGIFYYAWVIPGLAIVFGFALFYLPFFWNLPRREGIQVISGFCLFVFGAVGMELVGGWAISQDVAPVRVFLLATVEEFFEMLGTCVIILGLLNYLYHHCQLQVRLYHAGEEVPAQAMDDSSRLHTAAD